MPILQTYQPSNASIQAWTLRHGLHFPYIPQRGSDSSYGKPQLASSAESGRRLRSKHSAWLLGPAKKKTQFQQLSIESFQSSERNRESLICPTVSRIFWG
ncbi:hypothetical protein Q31a_23160 [Aureliella helgolandensis]|uniref:Uncharacterized protein n=1 Tax=Aureliella helgolandensis TaxID=2527968 RepID=A0A518G5Y9_9BACT|nr:hypothetical protein Q31a_23160 [Aureliella helgolandensis]